LSENVDEVKWVTKLFPENSSYTDVYDSAGLLNEKTILAHGIYLTEEGKNIIKKRGSSVSHCPNSNLALVSGCLNIRDLLERGIKVSLGTDVAAGYSISMLDACRKAIIASKIITF
jgi:guanine deaminase